MEIHHVSDAAFRPYGTVLCGYSFSQLIKSTNEISNMPADGTLYVASDERLETLLEAKALSLRGFGGLKVQIGYCNGVNTKLNALEYHRSSELDVACDDLILLLALQREIENGGLLTEKVKAFFVPAGTGVELYATTLHFAPCCAHKGKGFRMICALPAGTNGKKPTELRLGGDDALLFGANKWLLAHPDSPEAKMGAYVGLRGENLDIADMIG